jgi:asparagine synthase (glutamine-hydrolysing)
MCGLVGFYCPQSRLEFSELLRVINGMSDSLRHRGPDDFGAWVGDRGEVALGHRRLSIVDLSKNGRQPMISVTGRYVLVFNGEIYNHLKLRAEISLHFLDVINWTGNSDTETLLAGFELWGIEETVKKSSGMFAFAVWDAIEKSLTLGRDRFGEKPLYYGWHKSGGQEILLFGSEIKALKEYPGYAPEINRVALGQYMRYGYVPAPHSIYNGMFKLEAGCLLKIQAANLSGNLVRYWSYPELTRGTTRQLEQHDAICRLDDLLKNAVGDQMMADVPIGAFLSGGVDSSTIVSLMQAQSMRRCKTFSIGFEDPKFNEAQYAKSIANYLGTDHSELYISEGQMLEVIPDLSKIFCEPFADSSQIPTILVSRLAKQSVAVALTGDGGDEIFWGYERYKIASKWAPVISRCPISLRRIFAKYSRSFPVEFWDRFFAMLHGLSGEKFLRATELLESSGLSEFYLKLISSWMTPQDVVIGISNNLASPMLLKLDDLSDLYGVRKLATFDAVSYLPDDILVKVDRASMSCSLESRAPFLDHRVAKFSAELPDKYKMNGEYSKWILNQVLYKYLPKEFVDRPKMGFQAPMAEWLRGPLREWADALLDDRRIRDEGFFYPEVIQRTWREHLSKKRNWQFKLWNILMFQAWLEHEKGHPSKLVAT